jgi:hypothetical protein
MKRRDHWHVRKDTIEPVMPGEPLIVC